MTAVVASLFVAAACTGSPPDEPPPHDHAVVDAATAPLRAGERFVQLSTAQPFTPAVAPGASDEYRCLVIDPELAMPVFLTGVQFQPQNPSTAHHAITYAVSPESAASVRTRDAQSPGPGWTCFGMEGVIGSSWVDTWTPGGRETLFDDDLGYPLEPGSLLVLQIHYSLLGVDGEPSADRSSIRLRTTDGTPRTISLDTLPLSAPIELPCAPGESGALCNRDAAVADVSRRFGPALGGRADWLLARCGYDSPRPGNTHSCDYTVGSPSTVHAARGHMHLLGRSIKVELNPGTAGARSLLDVPAFNFDDQALHVLPAPVALRPGDILRTTCTYDAGLRAQLPQLRDLPPRYVVWGEGTADEMCAPLLTVSAAR
ncbi:monooxygenase [Paractinoplanes brasiliensis]|uniref:monooxygenase n=1 Tax=Paractinoplanes brasiliensis TaxID=52695 RepID=UPI001414D898|nr:monooxygenase [Actinoplanes brasiliensis]